MNILLALDHFTLLSNTQNNDEWLVDFVESGKVSVFYQDEGSDSGGYECELLGLPNWSYSYALALYRINENQPSPDSEEKANIAIKTALSRFPSIVEQLLVKNEVNTSGRSFQTDWPSILGYATDRAKEVLSALSGAASDPVVRACTSQAYETIARIFVHQNFKLWSSDSVLKWVYRNLHELKESENKESIISLSPAIMRYTRCDLSDYDDKFQTLPAEANPLDPALVAHALNVDPNRPRFVQRMQRGGGGFGEEADFGAGNFQGEILAGAPTQMVDPDWPLLEVFWRSALPWAHVEGVPPPPR